MIEKEGLSGPTLALCRHRLVSEQRITVRPCDEEIALLRSSRGSGMSRSLDSAHRAGFQEAEHIPTMNLASRGSLDSVGMA